MPTITIRRADYANAADMAMLIDLLDQYARDPMGGGEPLAESTHRNLPALFARTPHAFSILAWADGSPAGLANCFWGVSTFAAKPLVNIHDVIVSAAHRGMGVATALFGHVEQVARDGGACKVTLEVLSGNAKAKTLYASLGYGDYALDPEKGTALFWQKSLDQKT